jgi:hypothetical protein
MIILLAFLLILYIVFVGLLLQLVWNQAIVIAIPALRPITFIQALLLFIGLKLFFDSSKTAYCAITNADLSEKIQSATKIDPMETEDFQSMNSLQILNNFLKKPLECSIQIAKKRQARCDPTMNSHI